MRVFVLDQNRQLLDPCHPARARELLKSGCAAVFRRYPFSIILKDRMFVESETHSHRLKIDPGSKTTGFAVVNETSGRVVFAAELTHRGQQIRDSLLCRRALRRGRRNRHVRYRAKRFDNRRRPKGWLPPSLESRVDNVMTWVQRIKKFCPITALSQELVHFDAQALVKPEISGTEYQRGDLFGYEVREYLLQKWGRSCVYCGVENTPLEIEHIQPKSKGGSGRVSNLTLACHDCNQKKGSQPIHDFLKGEPELACAILSQAKAPLKDAAAVNTTRWELFRRLQETGLPVETGTGGRTKFNRATRGIDKTHWTDAACVGASTPKRLLIRGILPLLISAKGHGKWQRCGTDKHGFPTRHAPAQKSFMGFQTGDLVKAIILKGKYAGTHTGRIAIRFRPSFKLTAGDKSFDVHPKYIRAIHKADGFAFCHLAAIPLTAKFNGYGGSTVAAF